MSNKKILKFEPVNAIVILLVPFKSFSNKKNFILNISEKHSTHHYSNFIGLKIVLLPLCQLLHLLITKSSWAYFVFFTTKFNNIYIIYYTNSINYVLNPNQI